MLSKTTNIVGKGLLFEILHLYLIPSLIKYCFVVQVIKVDRKIIFFYFQISGKKLNWMGKNCKNSKQILFGIPDENALVDAVLLSRSGYSKFIYFYGWPNYLFITHDKNMSLYQCTHSLHNGYNTCASHWLLSFQVFQQNL